MCNKFCELCDDEKTVAIGEFDRTWHTGEVDQNIPMCQSCAEIPPDGMFTLVKSHTE